MKKQWYRWLGQHVFFRVQVASELWYDTNVKGTRSVHLFHVGWYATPGLPGANLYTVTLLWFQVQLGLAYVPKEEKVEV